MKKILSILALFAIIGVTSPVMAAPHGPANHGRPHEPAKVTRGHIVHAGHHNRPHIAPPRHHSGVILHTNYYPRHYYRNDYRYGYWGNNWCNYRLGLYPYPPCTPIPVGA